MVVRFCYWSLLLRSRQTVPQIKSDVYTRNQLISIIIVEGPFIRPDVMRPIGHNTVLSEVPFVQEILSVFI